jgi:hypothetical protein
MMARILSLTVIALVLGSSPVLSADDFTGQWKNVNDKTSGLTRLEISKNGNVWTIQSWGAGAGGEIDQGKATLHLFGDSVADATMKYGFASWDFKFKDTHLTLRLEDSELAVEDFNVFKDNSGRSNYRSTYKFKKAK